MKHPIRTIVIFVLCIAVGGAAGYILHGSVQTTNSKSGGSTSTTSSSTPSSNNQSATMARCSVNSLSASVAAATGGAAAGNHYYNLTLTNTGSTSCTIDGYPGVSLTDNTNAIVGSAADKDTSTAATQFSLEPKATATATLHLAVSDNFGTGTCKSGVVNVTVYPPDDTGYLRTPTTQAGVTDWCPGFTTTAFVKN